MGINGLNLPNGPSFEQDLGGAVERLFKNCSLLERFAWDLMILDSHEPSILVIFGDNNGLFFIPGPSFMTLAGQRIKNFPPKMFLSQAYEQ
ncbi:MAG: hypothetical protein LBT86_02280 [Deltaproteobacteria bacterium]|jgi:hypothetical protein|nr:hypothetical protein [Deltaproteobacteria bacterium]